MIISTSASGLSNETLLKISRRAWALKESQQRARLKKYGITQEEYDAMLQAQNGACWICQRVPKRTICIDHDHKTGKVRGLLCSRCNRALGRFFERSDWLQRAADYLKMHGR